MGKNKEGNAFPVTLSFYRKHVDICNEAILEAGFSNPTDFVTTIIEDWERKRGSGFLKEYIVLLVQPFLITLFLLLYSFEAGILWLNIIGGILASIMWYFAYRFTLQLRGIDPRNHWKSKRKRKTQE
jgi:hypothetical protein